MESMWRTVLNFHKAVSNVSVRKQCAILKYMGGADLDGELVSRWKYCYKLNGRQ